MCAWGAGVAAGHVVLGVIATAVLHVPGSALFFGLCALVTLVLSQVTAPLLQPRGDDGDGGGGVVVPDPDPPPWWPEFERDFQDYVQRLTSGRS
jgi:hypothetical protein